MTQSNRVQLTFGRETVQGDAPAASAIALARITGESLSFAPQFVDTAEIRADRMLPDPILSMRETSGSVNFEFSYPVDGSFLSELLRSALYNPWLNTNERTVVTDAGTVADTVTFPTGAAFVAGQLVRLSGFANAANNKVVSVTTGGATSIVSTASGLVAENSPAASARVKVVGMQGAAADIKATVTGLTTTVGDFLAAGISVGQWIKIGGTASTDRFTTTACNGWARVVGATAKILTLDNLPNGWAADTGAAKTIKLFFGDTIKNGTTQTSLTLEKGFLGQTVPTYIQYRGMVVTQLSMTVSSRAVITGTAQFIGMGGEQSTTPLTATPGAPTIDPVMAANANVGSLVENGVRLGKPNWARSFEFSVNNNVRAGESVDSQSPIDTREGECAVTGKTETYFGDNALLQKFYAGTPTSYSSRFEKNGKAVVFQFPRVVNRGDGNPQATGKNTDVMLPLSWQSSIDELLNSHIRIDRIEYFEA